MALTFVWLHSASSPHGFVFFPQISPLETTNKDRNWIHLILLHPRHLLCFSFDVQMPRGHCRLPYSTQWTLQWVYIYYHKYQTSCWKWYRYDHITVTLATSYLLRKILWSVCSSQPMLHLQALQSCSSEPPSPQSLKRSHCSWSGMQRRLLQVNSVFPQGRDLPATTSASVHTASVKEHQELMSRLSN